jgi:RNA polymerase sigma-70 factor (ECF subfamily)
MAADGDLRAFSSLYDRYAQRIYAWAAHTLGTDRAEDAVQEIYLLLWRRADQFDSSRGSFKTWFMTVARHEILRELRKIPAEGRVAAADEIERLLERHGETELDPAEHAATHASLPVIATALSELPPEQRRVLLLAYFSGLSQAAIADQLQIPLGTVKKRIRLGLSKLRAAVFGRAEDPPASEKAIR